MPKPTSYQWIILYWKEGTGSGAAPLAIGPFESHDHAAGHAYELITKDREAGFSPFKLCTLLRPPEVL